MKKWVNTAAIASLLLTGACSAVRQDLRHPGGYAGATLDKRTFNATNSKDLQLLRATLIIAVAARVGEATVGQEDADAFARQLAEASQEVSYAAADAGFVTVDKLSTCKVGRGVDHKADVVGGAPKVSILASRLVDDDATCGGYYVNFESHIPRIESRIVRAMLTALPTDKARQFLEDLAKGDLLSALRSAASSLGTVAGGFHRGAAVYRSGTEVFAASMNTCVGDSSYPDERRPYFDEEWETTYVAAQCLGLSRKDLFDDESATANQLPVRVNPAAFHALFRIARTACAGLPIQSPISEDNNVRERRTRAETCEIVKFIPKTQPSVVKIEKSGEVKGEPEQEPAVTTSAMPPVPTPVAMQVRSGPYLL